MEREDDNEGGAVSEPGAAYSVQSNPELAEELRRFADDHVWVYENHDALLREHPEQWIAVRNREVVASDTDLEGLLAKVRDAGHPAIGYITSEHVEMIL